MVCLSEELKRQAASLESAQVELSNMQAQLADAKAEMENIKAVATVSESTKQEAIDQVKQQWQEEVVSLQAIMKGRRAPKSMSGSGLSQVERRYSYRGANLYSLVGFPVFDLLLQ